MTVPSTEVEAVDTDVVEVGASDLMTVNNCTYSNNASHSKVVGQVGYDCCNNPVSWREKTQFSSCGGCFPCFPPPQ